MRAEVFHPVALQLHYTHCRVIVNKERTFDAQVFACVSVFFLFVECSRCDLQKISFEVYPLTHVGTCFTIARFYLCAGASCICT